MCVQDSGRFWAWLLESLPCGLVQDRGKKQTQSPEPLNPKPLNLNNPIQPGPRAACGVFTWA